MKRWRLFKKQCGSAPICWVFPFILRTDHASSQWLFRQNADGMTYKMIKVMQEFQFQVVRRPGEKHCNADARSRQATREPE